MIKTATRLIVLFLIGKSRVCPIFSKVKNCTRSKKIVVS